MVTGLLRRLSTGPFGTFQYDPETDRYRFDERAREVLGSLAHPEARYVDMLARMPKALRKEYEQWRMEAIETGDAGRVRVPFRLPTQEITLEVQVERTKDGVLGMVSDVTEDEQALHETRTQLQVMNFAERMARFGTWAYDIEADSFAASRGAVDLLLPGADPAEFTFDRVLELVHSDDRTAVEEAYVQALETGQVQHVEFRRDGDPDRWFITQFRRILDAEGEPVQTCGMIHETTDLHHRVKLEKEHKDLQEVQHLRERFVNAAAHELNQPMTPLKLELNILRRRLAGQEDVQKGIQIIERNLARVGMILDDLLDAARLQAGRLRVELSPIKLPDTISYTIDTLSPVAKQQDVALEWEPASVPLIQGDEMRVQQCLSNLVHNAIKFTRQGSTVTIRANDEASSVVVRIQDQGPGLDPEQARRVFEPFEQVHRAPAGFGGTGLGLYVTRSLMEAMGGSVEVESEPAQGACFVLRFKVAQKDTDQEDRARVAPAPRIQGP